ncbi:tRNA pseudouridine synthase B, partial [Pilobolus umbonatus]
LDPLAEGVLVMGVGEGCKGLRGYLQCEKEYLVTAKFGAATDTYDSQGVITHQGKTDHMTRELVENTMPMFRGCITQVPPIYSALRMNGKRLYDYARQGIALPKAIEGRQTTIDELEMVEYNVDECVFRVKCGGGTYMRSLVNDMAISMGTYGHMTALIRTRQGLFNVDNSLTLDED